MARRFTKETTRHEQRQYDTEAVIKFTKAAIVSSVFRLISILISISRKRNKGLGNKCGYDKDIQIKDVQNVATIHHNGIE